MTNFLDYKTLLTKADIFLAEKATVNSTHIGLVLNDDLVINGREVKTAGVQVKPTLQLEVPVLAVGGLVVDGISENLKPTATPMNRFRNPPIVAGENVIRDVANSGLGTATSGRSYKNYIAVAEFPEDIPWEMIPCCTYEYKAIPGKKMLGVIADDIFEATGIEELIIREPQMGEDGEMEEGVDTEVRNFRDRALMGMMIEEIRRLRARLNILEGI